jgi:transposase
MSPRKRSYTPEFKGEAAHRVIDSGRWIRQVAADLAISATSLGAWVRDERRRIAAAEATGDQPLSGSERAALIRLRKEAVEREKDLAVLKKVAGYFAANPTKHSGSR